MCHPPSRLLKSNINARIPMPNKNKDQYQSKSHKQLKYFKLQTSINIKNKTGADKRKS